VTVRLLAISGSLRRGSLNTALLRAAGGLLPPGVRVVHLGDLASIPPYDEDLDVHPVPAAVAALRHEITAADGLLFATPEYNASIPGQLKNAVDWASRPFPANALRGRPAAVIGASTGIFGAVWAQAELRKVLTTAGADVLDLELVIADAPAAFDAEGRLDDLVRADLGAVIANLHAAAVASLPAAGGDLAPARLSSGDDSRRWIRTRVALSCVRPTSRSSRPGVRTGAGRLRGRRESNRAPRRLLGWWIPTVRSRQ
jgi:chromate reductase